MKEIVVSFFFLPKGRVNRERVCYGFTACGT